MRIKFSNFAGDISWLQWSRFKRREGNLALFVWVALILHLLFWAAWILFVAPYPIAITLPIAYNLGKLNAVYDYVWPFSITLLSVLNLILAARVYKKDIFATWMLLGTTIFVQILVLAITFYLISFSTPF